MFKKNNTKQQLLHFAKSQLIDIQPIIVYKFSITFSLLAISFLFVDICKGFGVG